MRSIYIGDVKVSRLEELHRMGQAPENMFDGFDPEEWRAHQHLCSPREFDPETNAVGICLQSWVVESEGKTIIIDTGVGNDKPRMAHFDHMHTPYLDLLVQGGITPEDVDVVLFTHLHMDHVGWNTRLVDDEWVPTFPNATYVFPTADLTFWDPANTGKYTRRGDAFMTNVFADSITPVLQQAKVAQWDEGYVVDGSLRIEPAPGHTPGNAVIKLSSRGDTGVFTGDMMHSPVQIALPHMNSCFCEKPAESMKSRVKTLGWASDEGALIFAGHFGDDKAAEVARDGDRFTIKAWKGFDHGD